MPRTYKFDGVIIKRKNIQETDKIITFFTKQYGKRSMLAKGVRKINSKKAPHLEIFNNIRGFAVIGKTFDYIIEAETINIYSQIKSDLKLMAYTYRLMELVDILCPDNEKHEFIYHLLIECLHNLGEKKEEAKTTMEDFLNTLLIHTGFLPRHDKLEGESLKNFIRDVIERDLKSDILLTRLSALV